MASDRKIETSELALALERDQHQQRQEEDDAIQREEQLTDRLAAELAKRSADPRR